MKKLLNLNAMGVTEMNCAEMRKAEGGCIIAAIVIVAAAVVAAVVDYVQDKKFDGHIDL